MRSIRPVLLVVAACAVLAPLLITAPATSQTGAPPAPAGLTGLAQPSRAVLSWRPSAGATSYELYRGTSAGSITTRVTPAGFSGTTFTDTGAANNTTYYYAVRAVSSGGSSSTDQVARVTPRAATCSSGNAVVVENCMPGTVAWKSLSATSSFNGGIEGFLSASSVNAGGSVDLRISTDWDKAYRVEIYRTGYYGGDKGRLISTIQGRMGGVGFCRKDHTTTGLTDCSDWAVTTTITTSPEWTSGVYMLKLVREDNGAYSDVLLVVRKDGSTSQVLYGVPTSTYQAYNAWGGKSTYEWSSDGPHTVTGFNRAVYASLDRPYSQPPSNSTAHDWYTRTDVAAVSWLERQGYDVTYTASEDIHANGGQLQNHDVFISGAHDEYWSTQMFDAAVAARNAGTSLFFLGANAAYWRVRYVASPQSGTANRVMVVYKTIQGGPADPSGTSTSTWRDPAGPSRPENQLLGQMYIGDNASANYPLRVSAAEGRHRMWRYTPLASLATGTTAAIGTSIVGWEWDARVANGLEPAGVQAIASSAVEGNLVQNNGAAYTFGPAVATATYYRAASGATVFATGTNNWWRGLATNAHGEGEPDERIAQATVNALADMGAQPTTLQGTLVVDPLTPPTVSSTTPASAATGVATGTTVRATFDQELDPATVGAGDLTLSGPGGAIAGTVSLDTPAKAVVFTPANPLEPNTVYTATMGTAVKSWRGAAPASAKTWSFTTGPGAPPTVLARTPTSGATAVATDTTVTARFDRKLDPATVTTSTFTVRPSAGGNAVAAQVTYDDSTRTAALAPTTRLAPSTQYTAQLTTGIRASDGVAMTAAVTWTFTTGTNVQVSSRFPAAGATGISPAVAPRAVFSRAVDAATVTATTLRVTGPGGAAVAATVAYDPALLTATVTPNAPLATATTYTVQVSGSIRGTDGAPTDATSWTFTTATTAPAGPQVTSTSPAGNATGVPMASPVRATFDQALDPATVTTQSFTLRRDAGTPIAATVTYDAAQRQATLTPLAALAVEAQYTATLSTTIRNTSGTPLSSTVTWTFTTAGCPCALMSGMTPAWTGLAVRDYRPDPGPWSYELGTKVTVSETAQLIALRYWKEPGETGTHVGRVWSASGTQLAQATYQNESASGWQRQALATPLTLQPGQTYVLSVGLHDFYAKTTNGLATPLVSGPLQSVPGASGNGVFNGTAGSFPSDSWQSSNYFVDGVVKMPSAAAMTPGVTTRTPAAGATGVATSATVRATFNVPLDASTVSASTFTLTDGSTGTTVNAGVTYDAETRTAILTAKAPLETGTAYTAKLTTGVRSDDETPLPAAVTWSFSTVAAAPPTVTAVSPVDGTTDVGVRTPVTVTFSTAMDAATITTSSFRLTGPGGTTVPASVTYDGPTRTATLTPSSPLAGGAAYTARVTTAAKSSRGVGLTSDGVWGFTTVNCPCRLFDAGSTPTWTGLSTANGRTGTGPYTMEMGMKIRVAEAAALEALSFYKSPGETGTHIGRLWNASGQVVTSVVFSGETASGWQTQALTTPVNLTVGQVYTVSVGMNQYFVMTSSGLATELRRGPLRSVDDGQNGVFAEAAGTFPQDNWSESNYWIDAVVR